MVHDAEPLIDVAPKGPEGGSCEGVVAVAEPRDAGTFVDHTSPSDHMSHTVANEVIPPTAVTPP